MANEDILKQEIIAEHIAILYKEVRKLKRDAFLKEREEILGIAESPNNNDFVGEQRFTFDAVIVTSILDASNFLAQRTIPTSLDSPGWVLDTEFSSKPLIVTKAHQVTMPSSGDIVAAFFTGLYGDTAPTARYGMFGPAVVVLIFAKWLRNGNQSIGEGNLEEILWQLGTEVENLNDGFKLKTGTSDLEVLPAANGKLVIMHVHVQFDNLSVLDDCPRADLLIQLNLVDLFGTSTLINKQDTVLERAMGGSDPIFRLSCSHEFRVSTGDLLRVHARFYHEVGSSAINIVGAQTTVSIRAIPESQNSE